MKRLVASAGVALALLPATLPALDITSPDLGGRLGNWMVLGMFPHGGCGFPLADMVDPGAAPCLGDTVAGKSWERYVPAEVGGEWASGCSVNDPWTSCNGGLGIDLNCHYSGGTATWGAPDFATAYAFTYLVVDADMDVVIRTGSDDGYRYFIDGAPVVNFPEACRCYGEWQENVPYHFTAGTHRILVQVGDAGGHWGFTFALTDAAGTPITSGVRSEVDCDSDGDGITDSHDSCPHSNLEATVVIGGCNTGVPNTLSSDGCTLSDQIARCKEGATNHGQFVSCVAHLTNQWVASGIITGKQKGAIQRCAAQAAIP